MKNLKDLNIWLAEYTSTRSAILRPVDRILHAEVTAHQDLLIAESEDIGTALVLDGKWQTATADEFIYHESIVHLAALLQGAPKTALIIGGGDGGVAREVLRWHTISAVTIVDIDRRVVEVSRQLIPRISAGAFEDPRVSLIYTDGFDFVMTSARQWDLIILDLSEPISTGPAAKLFTREFYAAVAAILNDGGTCALQAGGIAPALVAEYAVITRTLRAVFPCVIPYAAAIASYPGSWGFLATAINSSASFPHDIDSELNTHVSGSLQMVDAIAIAGMLRLPLYVRRAIDAPGPISTLASSVAVT